MCSYSLWYTLKNIGINLVPIRPSNPLLHPSVHDYPIKNVFSFTSRLSKENRRKEEIYLSRTVLFLIFKFSLISELSRGFAAMPVCYGVKGLFCSFWLVLFSMLSSAFILFITIRDLICMHARFSFLFFFFFLNERLVIHPAIYSFVVHLLYHLSTFLSNLNAGHVWNEAVARYADIRIDSLTVIFSHPK